MDVPCREVLHKRQTILEKLETREVLVLVEFCHLENWEVSSNEVSIGISFPAKPKPEGEKYLHFIFLQVLTIMNFSLARKPSKKSKYSKQ